MSDFEKFDPYKALKEIEQEKQLKHREDGKLVFTGRRPVTKIMVGDNYTRKCPQCGGVQKLQLRQTEDGVVRDQPYCCRDGSVKKQRVIDDSRRQAVRTVFEDEGGHL